jgi:peptidoglycan/LPS O-acetylase OafA/YrhL
MPWMPGGFLGVDIFFVVSGYLITGQLWGRSAAKGRVDFAEFWLGRARRLLPALWTMIAGASAAMLVFGRDQLASFGGDAVSALTYTSNWWYVFHQRSYFVAAGRPPVLQHLWSLAVEEQFYLVWPVVIGVVTILVTRVAHRRIVLLGIALVLGSASAIAMIIGAVTAHAPLDADPSRLYFGTDTHGFSLMCGALLALSRDGDGLGGPLPVLRRVRREHSRLLGVCGLVAFGSLLVILWRVDEFSPALYRGGFVGIAVLSAVMVAAATRRTLLARILSGRLLRAIGERSYGLYLWHWPVFCFTRPFLDLQIDGWRLLAQRLLITFVVNELCYRLIELPVRRRGFRAAFHWRTTANGLPRSTASLLRPATAMPALVLIFVAGLAIVQDPIDGTGSQLAASTPGAVATPTPTPTPSTGSGRPASRGVRRSATAPTGAVGAVRRTPAPTPASTPTPTPIPTASPTHRAPDLFALAKRTSITGFGDSVMVGAASTLESTFASATIHAKVGEQAYTLLPQVMQDAAAGVLAPIVVIQTGNNGVIDGSQLTATLNALRSRHRVVLVTVHVPRPWKNHNLDLITDAARQFPNVRLMQWNNRVTADRRLVVHDGIHLTLRGINVYAAMVVHAALSR